MNGRKLYFILILGLSTISGILGHGMLMEPVNRLSVWRFGFNTPINYDDNGNNCGGSGVQHGLNNGKCGACGDNFADPQPRASENGGAFGTRTIVANFTEGEEFTAWVRITSNHRGYFEFSLCPLENPDAIETEECFKENPVLTVDGESKWILPRYDNDDYAIRLVLPKGLTCEHCALRWHWWTGNSSGYCDDGSDRLGCGPQETFRTCSDIAIFEKP